MCVSISHLNLCNLKQIGNTKVMTRAMPPMNKANFPSIYGRNSYSTIHTSTLLKHKYVCGLIPRPSYEGLGMRLVCM